MSIKLMSRVFEQHVPVSGTLQVLLLKLADFANDEGVCWPGVDTLAAACRRSRRQTQYMLSELEAIGLLSVQRGKGPNHTNRYRIHVPDCPPEKVADPVFHVAQTDAAHCTGATGCTVQPTASPHEADCTGGVQSSALTHAIATAPNPSEPSMNRHCSTRTREREPGDIILDQVAAAGGYLNFRGEDIRASWLAEIGETPAERVAEILKRERLPDGGRIRLPSGFAAALLATEKRDRDAKLRDRRRAENDYHARAEADRRAKLEAERPEREAKAKRQEDERRRSAAESERRLAEQDARNAEADAEAMRQAKAIVAAFGADPHLFDRAPDIARHIFSRLCQSIDDGRVLLVTVQALVHQVPRLRQVVESPIGVPSR